MNEDTLRALIWFCDDYHGGGGSRLYRLGCRARQAYARRFGTWLHVYELPLGRRGTKTYAALETRYADDWR